MCSYSYTAYDQSMIWYCQSIKNRLIIKILIPPIGYIQNNLSLYLMKYGFILNTNTIIIVLAVNVVLALITIITRIGNYNFNLFMNDIGGLKCRK
jgi:hypothetical protein